MQSQLVLLLLAVLQLLAVASGELTSNQEQIFLDLQNYYRARNAQVAVRILEWDSELSSRAQSYVSECDAVDLPAGYLQSYNTSGARPSDDAERYLQIVEEWVKNPDQKQQLLARRSTRVGCGQFFCDRLPISTSANSASAMFVACEFSPRYFDEKPNSKGVCNGRDPASDCPDDAKNCVEISKERAEQLGVNNNPAMPLCSPFTTFPTVPPRPEPTAPPAVRRRVTGISPRYGSLGGGQKITLFGEGFSPSDYDGANEVYFVQGSDRIPCDVTDYSSSSTRIVCVTRESTSTAAESTFNIEVYVTVGTDRVKITDYCSYCSYVYHYYARTPLLGNIKPNAITFGDTVLLQGRFYAVSFQQVEEEENDYDHFTRILVGGQLCDHMPTNDSNYIATIDSNGLYGSIECLPSASFNVGSMNVSLFLEDRGRSDIDRKYLLVSLDNKLQPYTLKKHADILDVSPRSGSLAGGTRISITLNTPLVNYTDIDTINVMVGGVPCEGVALVGSYDNSSVIECTTRPQPSQSTYYPGGRGYLREVWDDGYRSLDQLRTLPRTTKTAIHEQTFLQSDYVSDFGELYHLGQRLTGFFVPPMTSLYTFGIRFDDSSAFFLSPNASSDDILNHQIAIAPAFSRNLWDYYDSQISEPVFLEEGKYYYFMMTGNQVGGPWELSLGAKIHNLSLSSGQYDGDNEEQLVAISSTVVQEEHEINIEARPAVKTITITNVNLPTNNSSITCMIPLVLGTANLTISHRMSAIDLEALLNSLDIVQSIGQVSVIRDDSGNEYFSGTSDLDAKFSIVFLTSTGVGMADIPELTLRFETSSISCVNTTSNETTDNYMISVAINSVQSLSYPSDFKVGFELDSQPPRYTSSLPLNVTEDTVHSEISDLFAWTCDYNNLDSLTENGRVFYRNGYETTNENNRDNETALCGHYSERDPRTVWNGGSSNRYDPRDNRYVCFAYKGSLRNFRVTTSYTQITEEETGPNSPPIQYVIPKENVAARIHQCSSYPFSSSQGVTFDSDGWSDYRCVDVQECLLELYEGSRDHMISRVYFTSSSQFWVDELVISKSEVSLSRDLRPIVPNDVSVKYIEVQGEPLSLPILRTYSEFNTTGMEKMDRKFAMIVSSFQVSYTVRDCGYGIDTLVGYYDDQSPVNIEQVTMGSSPVMGTFDLWIADKAIRDIPADVEANVLEMLLEANLEDQGGFEVLRSGDCTGYSWEIQWETKGGDMPIIRVDADKLEGSDPVVTVTTLVDGGTWLRPIGGDMLRLPLDEPQVEVILDDTPSSCRGNVCSFMYEQLATPTIESIYPLEGQGGEQVTIYGYGFSDEMSDITVAIGNAPCNIVSANATQITCVVSNHPAGYYDISVLIEGTGVAVTTNATCFYYRLSVDSISPADGGIGGGEIIQINGNGFLEFTPAPADSLDVPFSYLPWFQYGLGLPSIDSLQLCPSYREMLSMKPHLDKYTAENVANVLQETDKFIEQWIEQSQSSQNATEMMDGAFQLPPEFQRCLNSSDCEFDFANFEIFDNGQFIFGNLIINVLNLYYHFPSHVFIGDSPCIIASSTITQITCIPITSLPMSNNVTVTVLSETVTLADAYEVSLNYSALIFSIDPPQGAVTGGTQLVISGSNFGATSSQDVKVSIGGSECTVQTANDTSIECVTGPNRPSYQSVLVSTPNGVAVLESGLMESIMETGSAGSESGSGSGMGSESSFFPIFQYKLVVYVNGDVLSTGSVYGGTGVMIQGGVFVPGSTQVLVGGQEVELQMVTMDTIQFDTPTSTAVRYIKLERSQFRVSASSAGLTLDLSWNEQAIEVQVGDTIVWELSDEVSELLDLQTVELTLEQGSDILASSTLIRGIESDTFSYTFDSTGSYVITSSSTPVFEIEDFLVNVTGPRPSVNEIELFVGEYKAEFVDNGMASFRKKRETSACTETVPETNGVAVIQYSPCRTPVVSYVEPNKGFRFDTTFTIRGKRFGNSPILNEVSFGGYSCNVLTSNESTITCVMDSSSGLPPTFVDLVVSVGVDELGNAYVENESNSSIVLESFISQIDPAYGSLEGGTDVIIIGDGFRSSNDSTTTVNFNGQPCTVSAVNYTEVRCNTQPSVLGADEELIVDVGISSDVTGSQSPVCKNINGCNFTYSDAHTPKVNLVYPGSVDSVSLTTITIHGTGFSSDSSSNIVQFGGVDCDVADTNETAISCLLPPLPATTYPLNLKVCNLTNDRCFGYAQIQSIPNTTITSLPDVITISPESGSVGGGTEVTIMGRGFNTDVDEVQVSIGNSECSVLSVNYSMITCVTLPGTAGQYSVQVSITDLLTFPMTVQYNYSMSSTPTITGISPPSGNIGDTITLTGTLLDASGGSITSGSTVQFGDADCDIMSISATQITCSPENNFVGTYTPEVNIQGMGMASVVSNVEFNFSLNIDSVQPSVGSLAGLSPLSLNGSGFYPAEIRITVCGLPCPLSTRTPSVNHVECILPPMETGSVVACSVLVETLGQVFVVPNGYTYREDLTPRVSGVNRTRGGTAGGSILQITGQGFTSTARVTIAGSECDVQSQTNTEIICTTGASGRNVRATIMVDIDGKGFAISDVTFWYVDLWSSPFTWTDGIIPTTGDFVVVPKGQTLVLDVVTPVLGYILIQGGTLIFDQEKGDGEVELHTQGGLITNDGVFQVGTEDEPFLSKTQIVLYGHVLSTEVPVYGAKTLALRRGRIDIHGRTINETWTKLSQTVNAGSSSLYLQKYVDWDVGGTIVIASTSFSQRENEERVIQSISAGSQGSIITLTVPLDYEHISVQQVIDGRVIDTSAEVGYLTRNVKIRGNTNKEWLENVLACPTEFRPGQFATQTCFNGRFGAETISDQFGSQIMIHAAEQNEGHVLARFGYVEVTHAGQAFRLGRYPIHYHLNGNVSGSYVRGCGIHHTFNRAVTVHAVDYLLIEKNVAFNILGHAYFLEDGIEEHNTIQDNLGIFVRASSSLLNVDITPATFWVVNPNNIVRRNAAAGGTHFGFWYRLPQHPEGPSATTSICPRHLPLEEFSDNSAHSFGWYGLWVFRQYHPSRTGACGDTEPTPVYFDRFLAWRCDKGIEFEQVGSLQIRDSIMLDNKEAGIEITDVRSKWSENDDGPLIKNTLVVGYSDITTSTGAGTCTEAGIKTPHSYFLTVTGVTFANFDRSNCYPIRACSFCRHEWNGGFEARFKNISYINEGSDITRWIWFHEAVQRDLDGTLTKTDGPSLLVPTSNLLPSDKCQDHPPSNSAPTKGSICSGDVIFGRLGLFNVLPSSLTTSQLNMSNDYGTDQLPFGGSRFRGGDGQMAIIPLNTTYQLTWVEGTTITNISYSLVTSGFAEDDYVLFRQEYARPLDYTNIGGVTDAVNVTSLDNPSTAETGDWVITDNTTLTYVVKGPEVLNADETFTFATYRCFYENCIPPTPPPPPTLPPPRPEGRPDVTQSWSDSSIWPNGELPKTGDDVYINSSMYIILDMDLPRLGTVVLAGAVELLDSIDHEVEADFLIIDGGRLAIGYPDTPFQHKAKITLYGNETSQEIGNRVKRNFGTSVGAKSLAVFGELVIHAVARQPTWTTLAATATAGSDTLVLDDEVEWIVGDIIVVTSTSYDAYESEVFEITSVNSNTIQLNSTLMYTHSGGYFDSLGSDSKYTTRAEVGLLTRNVVITNDDNDLANSQAFGCRVVVGQNAAFTGKAQIEGVEFSGCGQLGYTEDYDPRFALAILNLDDSYVRDCSFHDGYNTAIGVFDGDSNVVSGNVIHNTVGPSVVITGSGHNVTNNLASLSQFIGTYRRVDPLNPTWTANFELTKASRLTLIGNAAAGGAKAGYHTNGEECTDDSPTIMRNNTAHSSLHGIHLGYIEGDGNPSGCSRFVGFNIFNCYHYGIFSYTIAGVQVLNSVLTNNKAAVFVSVIGPGSLSHQLGTKSVLFERVLVVSASDEFACEDDDNKPAIANHKTSHSGLLSKDGGHVGFLIPAFLSGGGHFPEFAWVSITSYPAINGLTEIKQVTFANFHKRCGKLDTILKTSPHSDDANHPVRLSDISFVSNSTFSSPVTSDAKLFVHEPNLGKVNPSDCVDMDCDGQKHVILTDIGGTFTQSTDGQDRSLVSLAEFEWDGEAARGIGDYRIPKTILSLPNGSRIDVDQVYPKKGIVRGVGDFADEQYCMFNTVWNMYECSDIEHLMLIMESLDADTEVRRLSPIGLAANGFIDLLNGPQDQGWCGGYTCQERISTFFGVVANGLHYTSALTSTNPQKFALHLLNAADNQGIVICIVYTNPQRLDIYHNGVYVVPKNAYMEDGNIKYRTPSGVENEFLPLISDEPGSNFYNRDTKQLCVNMKGSGQYRIETTPVILLSLNVQVTVGSFFDEVNLVRNLALLLGIPDSKIRVVSVSQETVSKRRKRAADDGGTVTQTIDLEFGDPPQETLVEPEVTEPENNMTGSGMNMTDSGMNTTDSNTGQNVTVDDDLSFDDLMDLSEKVVTVVQTGEIAEAFNTSANITSASIDEPVPPPVDETGGVRATPDTGGPQPDDFANDTEVPLTFSEIQRIEEEAEQNMTEEVVFSIPTSLQINFEPDSSVRILEGIPLGAYAPVISMLDNNGEVVVNLGLDIPWVLTAEVISSPEGTFTVEASANFTEGQAVLSNLIFSHPGEYLLSYRVTFPTTADFGITSSQSITVRPRDLGLVISQQPVAGNTTFILYPYPSVRLVDRGTGETVQNHLWRNSTWSVIAKVYGVSDSRLVESYEAELVNGEITFAEIKINFASEYQIVFEAKTVPSASYLPTSVSSNSFSIVELSKTKLDVIYDVDFNSTIGGNEQAFINDFTVQFLYVYPHVEIINITLTEGSIIVSVIMTASNPQQLISLVSHATSGLNFQSLSFTFNNTILNPSNVTQDPDFIVVIPTLPPSIAEKHFVVILATVIPGGVLLISLFVLLIVCCVVYKHKRNSKVFRVQVKPLKPGSEERYVEAGAYPHSAAPSSVDEYFLLPDSNLKDLDTRSFDSHELDSLASTPASQRKVDIVVSEKVDVQVRAKSAKSPDVFFANPSVEGETSLEKLDANFDEVVHLPMSNLNNNNNNNNNNNVLVASRPTSVISNLESRPISKDSLDMDDEKPLLATPQQRPSSSVTRPPTSSSIASSLPKGVDALQAAIYLPPNSVPDEVEEKEAIEALSRPSTAASRPGTTVSRHSCVSERSASMVCDDMTVEDIMD